MRIAINTLPMKRKLNGVGNYIKNLVWALSAIDNENEYLIIASSDNVCHLRGLPGRFCVKMAPNNPILRVFWEQTLLPVKLKKERIDIYHGTSYAAPLAKTCGQVVTIHDMTFRLVPKLHSSYRRLYLRFLTPAVAKRCDKVIADSESTKRDLLDFVRIDEGKIRVIHLGVEKRFAPVSDVQQLASIRAKYDLPREFILFVGVIEPRKNLEILVDAYLESALSDQFDLVLGGGLGWDYSALLEKIASPRAKSVIRLPGYVADADLPAFLSLATVFVYPSLYEGFGLPVLEAMACGTPVITSSISSLPEVTGDAAILIHPSDQQALGLALRRVLDDPELRRELSQRGLERAKQFTWEGTAQRTLEVYRSVGGRINGVSGQRRD
jgi:glycosyltransferase involved in cell wall biosynthesis